MQRLRGSWSSMNRRQRRLFIILILLLISLACTVSLWVYYLRTRKPLTTVLPPAPIIAQVVEPHFLFNIHDLQAPIGIAVTPSGDRIYVVESDGERQVKVFDREGELLFSFSPPDTTRFDRAPVYITLDDDGNVYVSDRRRHTIDIFDADGNYQGEFPVPREDNFWSPLGVDIVNGQLLVTDVTKDKHSVLFVNMDGTITLEFGTEGEDPGQFWFPNAAAIDSQQRIYVSDGNNGRLQAFAPDGQFLTSIGSISLPRGMTVVDDRLYLVDAVAHSVWTYDVKGDQPELLFDFGEYGAGDGQFNFPGDIALDETGRLYITDRVNGRVQVWSY